MQRQYGGGTLILLCEAIRERLREALQHMRLETDHADAPHRAPQIIDGYLPPKRASDEPENPFVIVRPSTGKIEQDQNSPKITLIVGTYSEEYDGHTYALLVFERLLQSLQERPVLANRYRLEYPIDWRLYDDQPYPFWQMDATLEFTIPVTVQLDEGLI